MKSTIIVMCVAYYLGMAALVAQDASTPPQPEFLQQEFQIEWDNPAAATVAEYLKRAKGHGYIPTFDQRSDDRVVIVIEKIGETAETHGILNVSWKMRESWQLDFFRSEGILKLHHKAVNVEKRAPWLGEWREYKPVAGEIELPPELQVVELRT